jgi:hypothetical protein
MHHARHHWQQDQLNTQTPAARSSSNVRDALHRTSHSLPDKRTPSIASSTSLIASMLRSYPTVGANAPPKEDVAEARDHANALQHDGPGGGSATVIGRCRAARPPASIRPSTAVPSPRWRMHRSTALVGLRDAQRLVRRRHPPTRRGSLSLLELDAASASSALTGHPSLTRCCSRCTTMVDDPTGRAQPRPPSDLTILQLQHPPLLPLVHHLRHGGKSPDQRWPVCPGRRCST